MNELPDAPEKLPDFVAKAQAAQQRRIQKLRDRGYEWLQYKEPKYDALGNLLSPKAQAKREFWQKLESWVGINFPKVKLPLSARRRKRWWRLYRQLRKVSDELGFVPADASKGGAETTS